MAELRKEMNEKLERIMREVKDSRKTQSFPSRKDNGQTTSRIETPYYINSEDGDINASDTKNQENRLQDNPFRPSETNELRTQIQPISIQNVDLDDTFKLKTAQRRTITTQITLQNFFKVFTVDDNLL